MGDIASPAGASWLAPCDKRPRPTSGEVRRRRTRLHGWSVEPRLFEPIEAAGLHERDFAAYNLSFSEQRRCVRSTTGGDRSDSLATIPRSQGTLPAPRGRPLRRFASFTRRRHVSAGVRYGDDRGRAEESAGASSTYGTRQAHTAAARQPMPGDGDVRNLRWT